MTEADFHRLERDVEGLIADMREVRAQISALDTHGTAVVQVQFHGLEADLADLKAAYLRQEETKSADRRVMLGALLAAASALGMAVIGVVIQILTRPHP